MPAGPRGARLLLKRPPRGAAVQNSETASKVPIAIVGGGIGGLVLARILQLHGKDAVVYELDTDADVRRQGGKLDMHEESGQLALRTAGLYEEFLRHVHPMGEAMKVYDKAGTLLINEPAPTGGDVGRGRPEIERADLRGLLLASLEPGRLVWGHKLAEVSALGDGRHELSFTNGRRVMADLVVGADGTWSKVRPLVSAAKPAYCGVTYVDLHLSEAETRHPACAALVGPGMMFAASDGKALLGHGGRNIHLNVSLRVPEPWAGDCGIDWYHPPSARGVLLDAFAGWADGLIELIRSSDDRTLCRLIYALPTGHRWPRKPGVTLLGDAAHVMSPYAGEGANLAMQDAMELALALVKHGDDDVEAALSEFEAAMFPRAQAAAEESASGLELIFAPDAPRGLVAFLSGVAPVQPDR